MSNSGLLNKITNKLGTVIRNLGDLSSEEIGYKLQNIYWHVQQLTRDDYLIKVIKSELGLVSTSIVGILSDKSKLNLEKLLSAIQAFIKAYELIIHVVEVGYVDESVLETFGPYVDIDSGDIVPELNAHVKGALYRLLYSKFLEEEPKLDYFLLEANQVFEKSIQEIKIVSRIYYENMRQKLSEDIEGHGHKEKAQHKELRRQSRSSQWFFNPLNNSSPDFKRVSSEMVGNRTLTRNCKGPINLTSVPARHVITAASLAIKETSIQCSPDTPKETRESINIGLTNVNWQNKPSQNNQGNLFIAGLGRYGKFNSKGKYDSSAILSSIEAIKEWITEEELANFMVRYSKQGVPLSLKDLGMKPTKKNQLLVDRLNRVLFLTSCAEIWRYMYTSNDNQKLQKGELHITKIAFANAHARALHLIANGTLTMADVFDEGADFGLPTGSKITAKENLSKIIRKFIALNEQFNEEEIIDYDQSAIDFMKRFPNGGVASFVGSHIYELHDTYDEKGQYEDCGSSDEESSYVFS